MQVELAVEILQVPVPVDEARQHRLAAHIHDVRPLRNWNVAGAPDPFESASLDHNHGMGQWRPPGAVDQGPAADDERPLSHLHHLWGGGYFCCGTKMAVTLSMIGCGVAYILASRS
jgi:hypothetical protein